jgi:hypothetical protein
MQKISEKHLWQEKEMLRAESQAFNDEQDSPKTRGTDILQSDILQDCPLTASQPLFSEFRQRFPALCPFQMR